MKKPIVLLLKTYVGEGHRYWVSEITDSEEPDQDFKDAKLFIEYSEYELVVEERQALLDALKGECMCADENGDEIVTCDACKAIAKARPTK